MKLLLLILSIITFAIDAILCIASPTFAVLTAIGVTAIGLGIFAASFLPIP